MSLIDVSEYDEFHYAYANLGFNMMEQNATDEEVIESLKEIVDEFIVTKEEPDDENPEGYSRIYVSGDVDTAAKKLVEMGWKHWSHPVLSYVKKFYADELKELHGVTLKEFEEQLIEGLAHGVFSFIVEEDLTEEPLIEEGDEILRQIQEVLAGADTSR